MAELGADVLRLRRRGLLARLHPADDFFRKGIQCVVDGPATGLTGGSDPYPAVTATVHCALVSVGGPFDFVVVYAHAMRRTSDLLLARIAEQADITANMMVHRRFMLIPRCR